MNDDAFHRKAESNRLKLSFGGKNALDVFV
jgi:hypothetical protein